MFVLDPNRTVADASDRPRFHGFDGHLASPHVSRRLRRPKFSRLRIHLARQCAQGHPTTPHGAYACLKFDRRGGTLRRARLQTPTAAQDLTSLGSSWTRKSRKTRPTPMTAADSINLAANLVDRTTLNTPRRRTTPTTAQVSTDLAPALHEITPDRASRRLRLFKI